MDAVGLGPRRGIGECVAAVEDVAVPRARRTVIDGGGEVSVTET
jgi:hypothetical protein